MRAQRHVWRAAAVLVAALALVWPAGGALAREGELTGTLRKAEASGRVTIGYRESSIPFSYLGGGKAPIGYSIDLCQEIVDEMARAIGRERLDILYKPVTSETRFSAIHSGEIDLECGSTTANVERRQFADFSPVIYVSATKLLVPRGSPIKSYRDLGGRTVIATAGTTNEGAVRALVQRLGIAAKVTTGRDHAESYRAVKDGKADALALDDVLLYGLIAADAADGAKFQVLPDDLSYEPYGIMFARNDPGMATLVTAAFQRLAASREIRWIYERWFLKRLPNGERLNIPASEQLIGIWQMEGLPD